MQGILLDQDNQLQFSGGDYDWGVTDEQCKRLLLLLPKGHSITSPEVGVGIKHFLNTSGDLTKLEREIRKAYEMDGWVVKKLVLRYNFYNQLEIDLDAKRRDGK